MELITYLGVKSYTGRILLLLKLDNQIGGNIYWQFLAMNEAWVLEGVEYHIAWGGVQYICLIGCKIQSVDGYVAVCLGLTIDVFAVTLN